MPLFTRFTAAPIKQTEQLVKDYFILLLSSLYIFYHGKITCNIRLYLQFNFYKMSLQDFFFLLPPVRKKKQKHIEAITHRTYTFTHIQTKRCNNTHINKYRHSLTVCTTNISTAKNMYNSSFPRKL